MKAKSNFEKFGMAALIPGMQHMIDLMQKELEYMRMAISTTDIETDIEEIKFKPKKTKLSKGISTYWAKFTPEERSAEMRRRRKVTLNKRRAASA
jgi:hypothetical protein